MTYAAASVSPRRNMAYLSPTERQLLDTSEFERQARERLAEIAKRMGVRLPGATA